MASSSKHKKDYEVFLNFRGVDLRNNFVSHLYQALNQNGIYTFLDSEELRKGDQISPELTKAIEESHIAIIIFFKDYASSTWCLEELVKIMECKKQRDLMVFPVFYKVEPREVRRCRESYGTALAKHESNLRKDIEKVKRWKEALFDAANLSGWHLNDGDESELIQRIVKEISNHLNRKPLHVAKHPVGIDSRVVKVKSMLNLESDDGVLMMGLWGQGGIGKTTLAKALYNAIHKQFQGFCFLADVREASKGGRDLVSLQKQILCDILLRERLVVSNVHGGINLLKDRLCRKKVLLIVDDVDDSHQLYALAGVGKWFGSGSRIIVTTRDKHLLTSNGIYHVYEVQALDDSEAHELLSEHAFLTHQNLKIRTNLVESVLNYAKGLPLALEVLGAFLCCRREDQWESTLDEISKAPNKDINDVLKISYYGLEANEKEIFLHIACFFKGWDSEYVKKVLDSCNLSAVIGLHRLIERSLIRIEHKILQMHPLIQLMGMDIVNQECHDDPGRRSRLWLYDDVLNVLSRDMGDCNVKAIVLEPPEPTEIHINSNAFTKMRSLQLLILRNVHNSFQGPIRLPDELRWFRWVGCTFWIPEFSPGQKKLAALDMSNCKITVVPNQFMDFEQLKYLKLSDCGSLVSTPNFSCTPNLEELYLWHCKKLVEVHESIAYHDKLRVLNLWGCSELSLFPNVLMSKILQDLSIADCAKFERFPNIPHKLEGLKRLYLQGTAIKELPASIENLISLEEIHLLYCENLVSLPSNFYNLRNVKELSIVHCPIGYSRCKSSVDPRMKTRVPNLYGLKPGGCNLCKAEFLENFCCFPFLRELELMGNNITSLPTSIDKHDHLTRSCAGGCHLLRKIPELPPFLNELDVEECDSLQTNGHLTSIDQWVLRWLSMVDTTSLAQDSSFSLRLPGGEMPEWFQLVEKGSVSFTASKDLYDKFLGLVFCAVFDKYELHKERSVKIVSRFNGKMRNCYEQYFYWLDSDVILLQYFIPSDLWEVVDFGQFDENYAQFSLTQLSGDVKKWGFRIICKPLEDNLKVEIGDYQLINPAFLYEVGHDSTHRNADSSHLHEDSPIKMDLLENLQDCQMSTEEHSQIGSKRNREFILPQGKRIKTMLTSNLTDGDENEMRLIDILKDLHL